MALSDNLRDFWVAAAAAPIIALANQVALTDMFPAKEIFEAIGKFVGGTTWKRVTHRRSAWSGKTRLLALGYLLAYLNFVTQAVALWTSLQALATGSPGAAPQTVIAIEFFGLIAVVAIGVISAVARPMWDPADPAQRPLTAPQSPLTAPQQTTDAVGWALEAWQDAGAGPGAGPAAKPNLAGKPAPDDRKTS